MRETNRASIQEKENVCISSGQCDAESLKHLINRYLHLSRKLASIDPSDIFLDHERSIVLGQVSELANILHLFGIEV